MGKRRTRTAKPINRILWNAGIEWDEDATHEPRAAARSEGS